MAVVPTGCAYIFKDIARNIAPGGCTKAIKVCGTKSTGPIKVDMAILAAKGLVVGTKSAISDVLLGDKVTITLFQGSSFDVSSISIMKTPTLRTFVSMKYPNSAFLNDNVFSFIVDSSL
jgi:hypothetical protein